MVASALISAGASLLGGMMGPSPSDDAEAQKGLQKSLDKQRPQWIRYGAEKAGFNPLVFAGPSGLAPGLPAAQNTMGDAVARAGAALADGINETEQLKIQKAQLEQENERLAIMARESKLRANVPGIYNHVQGSPSPSPASRPVAPAAPPSFDDVRLKAPPAVKTTVLAPRPTGKDGLEAVGKERPDGPSKINSNELARFTLAGTDYVGSGRYSNSQTYEDAFGDIWSSLLGPVIALDAYENTRGAVLTDRPPGEYARQQEYRRKYGLSYDAPLPMFWHLGLSPEESLREQKARETGQYIKP